MSKLFFTGIIEREDLPGPGNFSIVSPDGQKVLFTGSLDRCLEKRDFFEKKYSKSLPVELTLEFDL